MNGMIKILAIDDNNDNLISIKALISESFSNAQIFTALTGEKGIELAISQDPDIIFLDIVMPGMDGFEVCKKLKTDSMLSDIPVVFVTAIKGDKESRIRALECGAEAFLAKPIDESELTAQIRAMVKIKNANLTKRNEKERLAALVSERTHQLEQELKERKRAEGSLKKSEEQLRGIFENLQDAYFRANLNGQFTMVSPSAIKMYGYSSVDELIGSPAELLYADPLERGEMISALKKEGRIEDLTLKARKKDGTTIWVSMNVQLVKDTDGKIVGTEGVVRDISERVKANDLLKESEERFKYVFESANVGKSITMPSGEINVNQAFCNMLGYSKQELENKKWQDITPSEDIEITQQQIDTLIRGEKNETRFNKRFIHKNGMLIWVDVSSAVKRDKQNNPLYFITTVIDISDQVKAKTALRKSEETARALLNGIPESAFLMELDGTVIAANLTVAQRLNFKLDDLVGMNMYKLVDPEVAERRHRYQEQVVGTKQPVQFEDERFGRTIDNRIHPIFDHQANVTQLAIIGIDITQRKLAEERLRESEMRSRSTFDQSPVGSVIVGLDKRFIKSNAAFCKFIGYSEDELIGKSISEITHPEDVEIGMLDLKLMVEGKKEIATVQKRYVRNDGLIVWGEISISLGRDSENKPLCFLPIIQDITERKKAEDELRILSRALEQSPDSILITNTNGEIEYINPALQNLSGYSVEELIGKNPRIFKSGETPFEIYKQLWDTITSGLIWEGEFQNRNKKGEIFWESATISPVTDSAGKTTHYLAIRKDITEQKRMTLELIAAKEKAEESDRLKSSFLANMSHEIRTPMNSIMGFASLLPEEDSKDLIFNYANIIMRNSEQLLHIIDDIVLYSSLQTRLFSFLPSAFNVQNLLTDIKQSFNIPEYQKGVELRIETDAEIPVWIRSDYEKIRQIFTNLVSNAFKYTCAGSITIGFKSKEDQIEFFVKDTGIGILPDELEKIFERFFRGSNVNKGAIGGTGLGLSIVNELVELLGGKIWVESNTDHNAGSKGSTFIFTLPVYKEQ
jgi:PAS domain S-box-containing protein